MDTSYKVKLEAFEGPLDLLLHLVNDMEIDIYDIPVATITNQYIRYIKTMQEIELNVASEYLVMAATLIEIKSAMLLPKKPVVHEDEYEEDPREQLIHRLIEYRKYKEAANSLKEIELEENQIYTRSPVEFEDYLEKMPVVQGELSIYDMIDALDHLFERKEWTRPLDTTINRVEISIEERMDEIIVEVRESKEELMFDSLFLYPNKRHVVATFLALLQLLKNNAINCRQASPFDPIYLFEKER